MTEIFIYGSCTTRDSVDSWGDDLSLAGYVARQSLLSATAGGNTRGFDVQAISSTFQKRMIKNDLNGNAIQKMIEALDSGAIVVWDLTDERNGFVELSDGRICSAVAIAHKELKQTARVVKHTKFIDPTFLIEWKRAALDLSETLGSRKSRVIVNHTPWAEKFDTGEFVSDSEVATPVFNVMLKEMTTHLESLGFPIAKLSDDEVRATRQHKWGPAPFHYSDETYRIMVKRIREQIQSN